MTSISPLIIPGIPPPFQAIVLPRQYRPCGSNGHRRRPHRSGGVSPGQGVTNGMSLGGETLICRRRSSQPLLSHYTMQMSREMHYPVQRRLHPPPPSPHLYGVRHPMVFRQRIALGVPSPAPQRRAYQTLLSQPALQIDRCFKVS